MDKNKLIINIAHKNIEILLYIFGIQSGTPTIMNTKIIPRCLLHNSINQFSQFHGN